MKRILKLHLKKINFMLPGSRFVNHSRLLHEDRSSTYSFSQRENKKLGSKRGNTEIIIQYGFCLDHCKKTAFSKGPQDNVAQTLFFRHLDVSKFFNIFVENSSPSSSVIYYFDFPTTDVIVKEK